jgi:hypothetical protein
MTETPSSDPGPSDRRASGLRNHAAAIVALFALAAVAWFWSRQQTQVDAGLGVLALLGAVLKGMWSWFLGLLGLD